MKHAFYVETEETFDPNENPIYSGVSVLVRRHPITDGEVKKAPAMVEIHINSFESGRDIKTIYTDLDVVDNKFHIKMFTLNGDEKTILCTSDPLPIKPLIHVRDNNRYTEYAAMIIEKEIKYMFNNMILPIIIRDKRGTVRIIDSDKFQDAAFHDADMTPYIIHELVHVFGGEGEDIPEPNRG